MDDEKDPFTGIQLDGQPHALFHCIRTSVSWKREQGGKGRCERWLLGETSKSVLDTMAERQGVKEH